MIDNNQDVDDLLKKRIKEKPVHFYIPFSQEARIVIKVREVPHSEDQEEKKLKVYLQGAPEDVLKLCLNYTIDGESCQFTEDGSDL